MIVTNTFMLFSGITLGHHNGKHSRMFWCLHKDNLQTSRILCCCYLHLWFLTGSTTTDTGKKITHGRCFEIMWSSLFSITSIRTILPYQLWKLHVLVSQVFIPQQNKFSIDIIKISRKAKLMCLHIFRVDLI